MSKKQHTLILLSLWNSEGVYVQKPDTFILSLLLKSKVGWGCSLKTHTFILWILWKSRNHYVWKPHTFILSILLKRFSKVTKVWKYVVFRHNFCQNIKVTEVWKYVNFRLPLLVPKVTKVWKVCYFFTYSPSQIFKTDKSMKVSDF